MSLSVETLNRRVLKPRPLPQGYGALRARDLVPLSLRLYVAFLQD